MTVFGERSKAFDLDRETTAIAINVHGGRPDKCSGWKAKMFNAAHQAAELGLQRGFAEKVELAREGGDIERARQIAIDVLGAKMVRALPERRAKLQARIALIRAHRGDETPEVRAAQLALSLAGAAA